MIAHRLYLCATAAALLFAVQTSAVAEITGGDTAMPWVAAPRSAVYTGMGGASYASSASVATALFSNPAVIPYCQGRCEAAASYISWMPEADVMAVANAGAAFRIGGRVGITVGGAYMNYGTTCVLEDGTVSYFRSDGGCNMIYGAGVGVRIIDGLSVGPNVKYARQEIDGEGSGTFVLDAMASCRIDDFTFTGGVRNMGPDVEDRYSAAYRLPSSAVVGAGYKAVVARDHAFEALLDVDCLLGGGYSVAAGGSYTMYDILTLRAGYRHASVEAPVPSYASTGLSLRWKRISVDGAYIFGSEVLRNSFAAGLRISF